MSATLDNDPDLRVRIVPDMDPSEPYDDGGSPIVRLDTWGWGGRSAHEMTGLTSYRLPDGIEQAVEHWGERGRDFLDRYLSIFHGVTATEWWHSGTSWYVTMDPADWREATGAPAGSINVDEWQAYCEGDVWGVTVERKVTWISDDDEPRTEVRWENTGDSVWGFYGHDAAIEGAADHFPGIQVVAE